MKKILLAMMGFCLSVIFLAATGCRGEDQPVLTFFPVSHTYTVDGKYVLDVTLDSVRIADVKDEVVFSTPDGRLAQIVIKGIIPGHDEVVIGGVEVTSIEGGLAFAGECALSATEKIVFSGTVIDFVLTLDIQTVAV